MPKYSAYSDHQWLFDIEGNDSTEALEKAKERDPAVTHVDLIVPGPQVA